MTFMDVCAGGRTFGCERPTSREVDEYPLTEEQEAELRAAWDRAEHLLRQASSLLRADDSARGFFREYIEHHEQVSP